MPIDLPLIWGAIIALGVFMYVLLDGFDLGIGILFPLAPEHHRDVMMNTVAPVWDGNETWLVLGGAGLLAAFPLAYAVLLPALYLPVLAMLIALIFRGVAFEFRFKAKTSRYLWDIAFAAGSTLAAFVQGLVLGAFLQGFEVVDRQFAGGPFDWFSPFAAMTGLAMICGYALLGAGWLIIKTEGPLQSWAYGWARRALWAVVAAIAFVSLWTPWLHPEIAERWFSFPEIVLLSPVPLATAGLVWGLWRALERREEYTPFLYTVGLFALSYIGLAISLWPNIIPHDITLHEAAAPPDTQRFVLVGAIVLLPVITGYTAYTYWLFRGKVRDGDGYH